MQRILNHFAFSLHGCDSNNLAAGGARASFDCQRILGHLVLEQTRKHVNREN